MGFTRALAILLERQLSVETLTVGQRMPPETCTREEFGSGDVLGSVCTALAAVEGRALKKLDLGGLPTRCVCWLA